MSVGFLEEASMERMYASLSSMKATHMTIGRRSSPLCSECAALASSVEHARGEGSSNGEHSIAWGSSGGGLSVTISSEGEEGRGERTRTIATSCASSSAGEGRNSHAMGEVPRYSGEVDAAVQFGVAPERLV
jgi:hypothetical protein